MTNTQYTTAELARLMRSAADKNNPYVVFTGAGCSVSAGIPSAKGLIKAIKQDYPIECKSLIQSNSEDYGQFMGQLGTAERSELIQKYVVKANINWAHIALACMLKNKMVNRVLTFNFDNLMARACGLIGLYPATYDMASVDANLHNLIAEQAIVHLHGQSHGFYQMNTAQETKQQAQQKLSAFIERTLEASPCLFIGYSGSTDAFFTEVQSKYTNRHRIVWVGHDKEPNAHVAKFISSNPDLIHYIGGADADGFLIDVAQHLECFPPQLFRNPFEHLLEEFQNITTFPKNILGGKDVLEDTRNKLQAAIDGQSKQAKPDTDWLLLQGKYDELIEQNKQNSENLDLDNVAWAYTMQGNALLNLGRQQQDPELYKQSFEKYAQAVKIKADMHEAWYCWGIALAELAKQQEDPELYKQSFEKYDAAVKIKADKYEAWNNWGAALFDLMKIQSEPERSATLAEAREKLENVERINSDEVYSLACMLAFIGDIEGCREKLFHCKRVNTLPDKAHLMADEDLASVRDLPWFSELLR